MIVAISFLISIFVLIGLVIFRRWQVCSETIEERERREELEEQAQIENFLRLLASGDQRAIAMLSDYSVAAYVAVEAANGNALALEALKVRAVSRSIRSRPKIKAMPRGVA